MQRIGHLTDPLVRVEIGSIGDQHHLAGLDCGPHRVGALSDQPGAFLPFEDEARVVFGGEADAGDDQIGIGGARGGEACLERATRAIMVDRADDFLALSNRRGVATQTFDQIPQAGDADQQNEPQAPYTGQPVEIAPPCPRISLAGRAQESAPPFL